MRTWRDILIIIAALGAILVFAGQGWAGLVSALGALGPDAVTPTPSAAPDTAGGSDGATGPITRTAGITPTLGSIMPASLTFFGVREARGVTFTRNLALSLVIPDAQDKDLTIVMPPARSARSAGEAALRLAFVTCQPARFVYATPWPTATPAPTAVPTPTLSVASAVTGTLPAPTAVPTSTLSVASAVTGTLPAPAATPQPSPVAPVCASLSVDAPADLPAGEYTTTLEIRRGAAAPPEQVAVQVKVRYGYLWPILMVALGVLATEFLAWWGRRSIFFFWRSRRAQWLDLLSEKTSWTEPPAGFDLALAQQQAAALLRQRLDALDAWLAGAPAAAADKLPAHFNQLSAAVDALHSVAAAYLAAPWDLQPLASAAGQLPASALGRAQERFGAAHAHLASLDAAFDRLTGDASGFRALLNAYQAQPPADADIRAAWELLAGLQDAVAALRLARPAAPSPKNLPDVAQAIGPAEAYLAGLVEKVTAAAGKHLLKVAGKDAAACVVLAGLAGLADPGSDLRAAQASLAQAKTPFADGGALAAPLAAALSGVRAQLSALPDLSTAALRLLLLKQPLDQLLQADSSMAQPQADPAKVWEEMGFGYEKSRRWVRIGRGLRELRQQLDPLDQSTADAVRQQCDEGYRSLLNGDSLAAEVSLQAARETYLAARRPDVLRKWREIRDQLRPLAERRTRPPAAPLPGWLGYAAVFVLGGALTWLVWQQLAAPSSGLAGLDLAPSAGRAAWMGRVLALVAAALILALLLAAAVRGLRRIPVALLFREWAENSWPWLAKSALWASSQLLTIVIAVVLIILGQNLAGVADTWGSPFQFVTAFGWGVLANRLADPVQSTLKRVQTWAAGHGW